MSSTSFFKALNIETLKPKGRRLSLYGENTRPLGEFSHAIAENMALAINQGIPELLRFSSETAALLQRADWSRCSESALQIAWLDIVYFYTGIIHSAVRLGLNPRVVLPLAQIEPRLKAISAVAGKIPVLTYEDVALINPLETDPRTFTDGHIGGSEYQFLLGHLLTERKLALALENLHGFLNNPPHDIRLLREAEKNVAAVTQHMKDFLDNMPTDNFNGFRIFFSSNPVSGYAGASGRFSAKMYHLRIMLDGDLIHEIDPVFYSELFEFAQHFPKEDYLSALKSVDPSFCPLLLEDLPSNRQWVIKAIGGHDEPVKTLAQFIKDHGNLRSPLASLSRTRKHLDHFSIYHLRAVSKHIFGPLPKADREKALGTGGSSPITYLTPRVHMHRTAAAMWAGLAA